MNKSVYLINALSVILVFSFILSAFLAIDGGAVSLLLVPAAAYSDKAYPDIFGFGNVSEAMPGNTAQSNATEGGTETPNNDASNTADTLGGSVSTAVDEVVMGNIVKKTLSPYTANLKCGRVCINNQSGADIDIETELSKELEFTASKGEEPQILIYHTHTTEGYMLTEEDYYTDSDEPRTTDDAKNVVAVGEKIAEQLRTAGYSVIHDTTVHDYPGFTGSYTRSAETVKSVLSKYPSVKIAIDVHRDSISQGKSDKVAPVVTVNGREAAQVMLVMGSETGSITDYPYWRQNLRFAMKLQYLFETDYPQFARSLLLKSTKYNQNLTTGSILIEMGSEANTLEQALYSGELVGKTLVTLLNSG